MSKKKKQRLQIYIELHTNDTSEESKKEQLQKTEKNIREQLCKAIARQIYNSRDFQEFLT